MFALVDLFYSAAFPVSLYLVFSLASAHIVVVFQVPIEHTFKVSKHERRGFRKTIVTIDFENITWKEKDAVVCVFVKYYCCFEFAKHYPKMLIDPRIHSSGAHGHIGL